MSQAQNQPQSPIYLDHSATTPLRSVVLEAMLPYFSEIYGNPSSIHSVGRRANVALEGARRTMAEILNTTPRELIFTSGGTEGDNAALRGIALARRQATGANRIITTPIEHHAVLHTAFDLRDHFGFDVTLVPLNHEGLVDPADVETALGQGGYDKANHDKNSHNKASDVALVSIMYANNEIGTIQPIAEIGALCRSMGVPLHTDAVQAAGKLTLDVDLLHVDALSISAHKFYGPKGVGLLYLRSGTPYLSFMTGGSHEGDRRAGTENLPAIVGMAKALELVEAERPVETERLRLLRDHLIGGILEGIDGAKLTGVGLTGAELSGDKRTRLDNIASFVIQGVESEGVLIGLDLAGIAASSGSACTSGSQRSSHVLEAIGISPIEAQGALRLSLGHDNTPTDIDYVVEKLPQIVAQVKGETAVML